MSQVISILKIEKGGWYCSEILRKEWPHDLIRHNKNRNIVTSELKEFSFSVNSRVYKFYIS